MIAIQVSGEVTSGALIDELLASGAAYVVVDARAMDEPAWIAELAMLHLGEIVVACDVHERSVSTRGWVYRLPIDLVAVVNELNSIPVADSSSPRLLAMDASRPATWPWWKA